MGEHPIQQPIRAIDITSEEGFVVGRNDVTRIEACEKSSHYSAIPYVRVWTGETCIAELCQHNIVAVYFDPAPAEPPSPPWHADTVWPTDHTGKSDCLCAGCIPF